MVPLILVWAMVLGMGLVLLLAYNEDAAWSLVELAIRVIQSMPFVGDRFTLWMEAQTVDGVFSPDLGAVEWKQLVLETWAWLSLALMLAGAVFRRVISPFPTLTLKRKLAIAAGACGVVMFALVMLYFVDHEGWVDSVLSVLASAAGMGLAFFAVNAWFLCISHALGWASRAVMNEEFIPAGNEPP
ncbi:MAG: hypothetical protein PVG42_12570 [Lysobacterales bacterium]